MTSAPSFRGQFKDAARVVVKDFWDLDKCTPQDAIETAKRLILESRFIYEDGVSTSRFSIVTVMCDPDTEFRNIASHTDIHPSSKL